MSLKCGQSHFNLSTREAALTVCANKQKLIRVSTSSEDAAHPALILVTRVLL